MVEILTGQYIRVHSELNDWMDFVFFVNPWDVVKAVLVLNKAADQWWDENDECIGDYLEECLKNAGIEYEVYSRVIKEQK